MRPPPLRRNLVSPLGVRTFAYSRPFSGCGPYRFSPSVLGDNKKTNNVIDNTPPAIPAIAPTAAMPIRGKTIPRPPRKGLIRAQSGPTANPKRRRDGFANSKHIAERSADNAQPQTQR